MYKKCKNFKNPKKRKIVINIDTIIFVIAFKNKFPKNTMVRDYNTMHQLEKLV